ncbi:MAG: hypothetical protein K2I78_01705 [Clostridia bacterium]|nr:hypothetical protein [Clostridia bacterium]MDE7215618.1 hypothetical protein [Clostridia bacterium]
MKDTLNDSNNTMLIKTKQSLDWYIAYDCLEMLDRLYEIMQDQEFRRLYDNIMNYVSDKLDTHCEGKIHDIYVMVEQNVKEDEYQDWLKKVKSHEQN